MKLFIRCLLRKPWRASCSEGDREYNLPIGGSVPSSNSIFRSKGLCGARVEAFLLNGMPSNVLGREWLALTKCWDLG